MLRLFRIFANSGHWFKTNFEREKGSLVPLVSSQCHRSPTCCYSLWFQTGAQSGWMNRWSMQKSKLGPTDSLRTLSDLYGMGLQSWLDSVEMGVYLFVITGPFEIEHLFNFRLKMNVAFPIMFTANCSTQFCFFFLLTIDPHLLFRSRWMGRRRRMGFDSPVIYDARALLRGII